MEKNTTIEFLDLKEHASYLEHLSQKVENENYLEYLCYEVEKPTYEEFKTDEQYIEKKEKKKQKEDVSLKQIEEKVTSNISRVTPIVSSFVAITASVALGFVVFGNSLFEVRSLDVMADRVVSTIWVKERERNSEREFELQVKLYTFDYEYNDSRYLEEGENLVEFEGLTPETQYTFEIVYIDFQKDSMETLYTKEIKTQRNNREEKNL